MTTPQIAQGLAGLGRNGDSVLVHMQPQEVAGLQAIAKANGTSLTINPDTGMPEAFSLGNFFKSLLPTIAGVGLSAVSGGALSPLAIGLITGGVTAAATGDIKQGIMGGLGGYGGAGLGTSLQSFGSQVAVPAQQAGQAGAVAASGDAAVQNQLSQAALTNVNQATASNALAGGPGVNLSDYTGGGMFGQTPAGGYSPDVLTAKTDFSAISGANPITPTGAGVQLPMNPTTGVMNQPARLAGGEGLAQLGSGIKNAISNPSSYVDYAGGLGKVGMQVGMPLGMAALSGIEPPEMMTQEEYDAERRRKFNQPLNLNYDTGLRLAGGGAIAFDDGGAVPNSKLSLRREEEQMMPQQNMAMQPAQTELGIAALKPGAENDVSINIQGAQPAINPLQQQEQQIQPLAGRAQSEGIPALMQEMGGQGVDFEKLYGRSQAPAAMGPRGAMQFSGGYGPNGQRLAAGGNVQQGGTMDLYQGTDSQATFGGTGNFGLGRLSNLAQQQSLAAAESGRFAGGGVPKLEDGGFVVPADVTFYLGNHNTEKGQQRLAQMYGGQPITGPGTGLSDSIPTSIEGKEPARIANGEVYIPRKAVMAHGGPEKFYKMMDKVRKKATGSTKQAKAA